MIEQRGKPDQVICDNGAEFTSKAMFFGQNHSGVRLNFIQPEKPTQNTFVESLSGKFRNEYLNQYWFGSIEEVDSKIKQWRMNFNNERPRSSLNYMAPVTFANQAA